uniref:PIR2-like helical domain-containing protein n=1 Tax=Oryza punctata TaxID=4537 RepID=A0A0E0LIE4_ORYPU
MADYDKPRYMTKMAAKMEESDRKREESEKRLEQSEEKSRSEFLALKLAVESRIPEVENRVDNLQVSVGQLQDQVDKLQLLMQKSSHPAPSSPVSPTHPLLGSHLPPMFKIYNRIGSSMLQLMPCLENIVKTTTFYTILSPLYPHAPIYLCFLNKSLHLLREPCKQYCASTISFPRGKSLWRIIASRSYSGLVAFMTAYFRYLSNDQARHYLHIASHDLPVAIKLVHHDRRQSKLTRPRLLPDGGKIKTALRVAALKATHPAPDQLASLMARSSPPLSNCLVGVTPPIDKGDKAIGAGASPNYDLSPCNHILSLRMCLLDAIHGFYIRALTSLPAGDAWKRQQGRFIRSLLIAGHCYVPLDPVSNIIVSTVWYDINFPPPSHEAGGDSEFELPGDIFDTSAMSRVESHSLDGLVAALCAISKPISKHEALEYLWSMECSLIEILLHNKETKTKENAFTETTKASDHPKRSMFGSFLTSLSSQNLEDMRECLFISSSGDVWDQLYRTIKNIYRPKRKRQSLATATVAHTLPGISKMWSAFVERQTFVRTKLEELLDGYGQQYPWVIKLGAKTLV